MVDMHYILQSMDNINNLYYIKNKFQVKNGYKYCMVLWSKWILMKKDLKNIFYYIAMI